MGVAAPGIQMARWLAMTAMVAGVYERHCWICMAGIAAALIPPLAACLHALGDNSTWVSFLSGVFWAPLRVFGA